MEDTLSITNDYFLLFHGKQIEEQEPFKVFKNINDFFEISSLILCLNSKVYDKFMGTESFKKLLQKISSNTINNLNDVYRLQYSIVENILMDINEHDIKQMHESFEYLKNEEIINESNYNKLISLFDPNEFNLYDEINLEDDINIESNKPFNEVKADLENVIFELKDLFKTDELKDELELTNNYLNNQKFSIGITGVMNAGKSTMLNALMGQEILGSAVVPETANLTVVKYDFKPSAKVVYWNQQEWSNIEKSANEIDSIKAFVHETKNIFKDTLSNYIKEEAHTQSVDINDLASYTSAEASGKKCNLVKYVELKSNLSFLKNGIEIVDTPGLDDPVIQREEITKEYLSACDMMIHLMNVSQSATLKDVEFIIDALLYQNITKLLIVITRADTVTKEQLNEVIEYTKSSIRTQLKKLNKDSKLNYILDHIQFIPISGKMALYHRTGRSNEAIKEGYQLEDTGILDIEAYLEDTLFGKNSSKSNLVIKSSKQQLIKTIEKEIKALNYELILLSKSKDELELELEEFNKKKTNNEKIFSSMQTDINLYKKDAQEYINNLQLFLKNELEELQEILKQRVFGDVRYSFEKTKKRPESSRIKTIVETTIKDGIIDIIRDYRYKFIKKSQSIGEICGQKYQEYGFTLGHKNDNFDALGFFKDDFKSGFLTTSNDIISSKIINHVNKSKANKLNLLNTELQKDIKDEFEPIQVNTQNKSQDISKLLIEEFFIQLNEPLNIFKEKMIQDEQLLKKQIEQFEDNEKNKDEIVLETHKKVKRLELIQKGLK